MKDQNEDKNQIHNMRLRSVFLREKVETKTSPNSTFFDSDTNADLNFFGFAEIAIFVSDFCWQNGHFLPLFIFAFAVEKGGVTRVFTLGSFFGHFFDAKKRPKNAFTGEFRCHVSEINERSRIMIWEFQWSKNVQFPDIFDQKSSTFADLIFFDQQNDENLNF